MGYLQIMSHVICNFVILKKVLIFKDKYKYEIDKIQTELRLWAGHDPDCKIFRRLMADFQGIRNKVQGRRFKGQGSRWEVRGVLFFGDAEFFHEVVEGGPADAEFGGGLGQVVAVADQGLDDQILFQAFAGFFESHRLVSCER